jgi:hypothetical protein
MSEVEQRSRLYATNIGPIEKIIVREDLSVFVHKIRLPILKKVHRMIITEMDPHFLLFAKNTSVVVSPGDSSMILADWADLIIHVLFFGKTRRPLDHFESILCQNE